MKIFIYSTLFILLFSLVAKLQVCINYLVNQTYYAEVLCENKAVKNSCCKGKCAVGKELANLSAKEENNSTNKDQNSSFKLNKAEEATLHTTVLNFNKVCINIVTTQKHFAFMQGNFEILFRPPIV